MTRTAVPLAHREFGAGAPLVIVHGLLGAGRNWLGPARALAADRRVLLPDLRNHGDSPHAATTSLPELAQDLAAFAAREGLGPCPWLGHSLGGKAVMQLALRHPERVSRLVVVDIAPVADPERRGALLDLLEGLEALAPERLRSRAEAKAALGAAVSEPALCEFLLQNLRRAGEGYAWQPNLPALRAGLDALLAFPEPPAARCEAPALFVAGERSGHDLPRHWARVERLFPAARLAVVPGAGHWVHAERPEALLALVREFLGPA